MWTTSSTRTRGFAVASEADRERVQSTASKAPTPARVRAHRCLDECSHSEDEQPHPSRPSDRRPTRPRDGPARTLKDGSRATLCQRFQVSMERRASASLCLEEPWTSAAKSFFRPAGGAAPSPQPTTHCRFAEYVTGRLRTRVAKRSPRFASCSVTQHTRPHCGSDMNAESAALVAHSSARLLAAGSHCSGRPLRRAVKRRRAAIEREHTIADIRRAEAISDARELLALFVRLSARIKAAPEASRNNAQGVADWRPEWAIILTSDLYERMSTLNMVLPSLDLRKQLATRWCTSTRQTPSPLRATNISAQSGRCTGLSRTWSPTASS